MRAFPVKQSSDANQTKRALLSERKTRKELHLVPAHGRLAFHDHPRAAQLAQWPGSLLCGREQQRRAANHCAHQRIQAGTLSDEIAKIFANASLKAIGCHEAVGSRFSATHRPENEADRQERQEAWHPVLAERNVVNDIESLFAMQPATFEVRGDLPEIIIKLQTTAATLP